MDNNCIVTCPCCGSILQISNGILGSYAYPFYFNIQMCLKDMIQNSQNAQVDYSKICRVEKGG